MCLSSKLWGLSSNSWYLYIHHVAFISHLLVCTNIWNPGLEMNWINLLNCNITAHELPQNDASCTPLMQTFTLLVSRPVNAGLFYSKISNGVWYVHCLWQSWLNVPTFLPIRCCPGLWQQDPVANQVEKASIFCAKQQQLQLQQVQNWLFPFRSLIFSGHLFQWKECNLARFWKFTPLLTYFW